MQREADIKYIATLQEELKDANRAVPTLQSSTKLDLRLMDELVPFPEHLACTPGASPGSMSPASPASPAAQRQKKSRGKRLSGLSSKIFKGSKKKS